MKTNTKQWLIDVFTGLGLGMIAITMVLMLIIPTSVVAEDLSNVEEEVETTHTYIKDNKTFEFLDFSGKKLIASGTYGSSTLKTANGEEKVTEIGGRLGKGSDNSSAFVSGSYTSESNGVKWIQALVQLQAQGDPQTFIKDVLEGRLIVGGEFGFVKLDTNSGTDTDMMYGLYGGLELPVLDSVSIDITYHYDWTRLVINSTEIDKITAIKFNLNYFF